MNIFYIYDPVLFFTLALCKQTYFANGPSQESNLKNGRKSLALVGMVLTAQGI